MRAVARTNPGRVRDINEDSVFSDPDLGLVMVADGMGGHAGGEIASNLAVELVAASLRSGLAHVNNQSVDIQDLLQSTITAASDRILDRVALNPDLKGMGCTLVLALERHGALHLAHMGDSRAYLLGPKGLRQVTEDHSVVAEMVRAGEISSREARGHRLRNYLTRSLGQPAKTPDITLQHWSSEDRLLLCSDGLTNMVNDHKIEKVMTRFRGDPGRACQELIDAANSGGGTDNISVVIACPE